MGRPTNTIVAGDCIENLIRLPEESVNLVFADPPFNIGFEYDVYDDSVDHTSYLDWSSKWIAAVHRVLKSDGTFWLAIGDEYAAELKLASQDVGFHCRSWVIWYYTFGVNCSRKFTRSHAHLFHFVKDPTTFTFRDEDLENRVPSARELVYNDKRANPKGRLPDDTWIIRPADSSGTATADSEDTWSLPELEPPTDDNETFTLRPQELGECFNPSEDTWYVPRVAGTFKERAGFHGCQMPEQLLGRIIRTCSNPSDFVLDPFSGSATTLAVAKKLGRKYLGFDLSQQYVDYGLQRLESICVGDPLSGSPEPSKLASASTASKTTRGRVSKGKNSQADATARQQRYNDIQLELTQLGVMEAFKLTHDGYSIDRVVADPDLNASFREACRELSLVGDGRTWNTMLFRLRKAGRLAEIDTSRRTSISWCDHEPYLFASEIALQSIIAAKTAKTIDEILCDPTLAEQFDQHAMQFAPGYSSLEYRWAALGLRKAAKTARTRGSVLSAPVRFDASYEIAAIGSIDLPELPGVYVVAGANAGNLYAGETSNLRDRLHAQFAQTSRDSWEAIDSDMSIRTLTMEPHSVGKLAWQSCLAKKHKTRLNYAELYTTV